VQVVQEAPHEGVTRADRVDDAYVGRGPAHPLPVEGGEDAVGAEGDDDEARAVLVEEVGRPLRGDAPGQQVREVVVGQTHDVRDGAPARKRAAVDGRIDKQGADVGIERDRRPRPYVREQLLDRLGAGRLYEREGPGVQAGDPAMGGRRQLLRGPLPVGGVLGVEGVVGMAVVVEVGHGQGAGLVGGDRTAQVHAGLGQMVAEEPPEDVLGQPPQEAGRCAEPGKRDGGVRGAAAGQYVHSDRG
jgi:hypothetical protein